METVPTTTKKGRPIIFSGEMVRAILSGQKTQTRRTVKPAPAEGMALDGYIITSNDRKDGGCMRWGDRRTYQAHRVRCQYGRPGDRLWVREIWDEINGCILYKADSPQHHQHTWKPSMFMPRRASRILLEITHIRVERLWSISTADCIAEGCRSGYGPIPGYGYSADPKEQYFWLWDRINGKNASNANPWVWVVGFNHIGGAA